MRKLREHAAEISRNLLGLETYLQLCGNRELKLENCRKVLEYNEIRIVVQTTELILEIWGQAWNGSGTVIFRSLQAAVSSIRF